MTDETRTRGRMSSANDLTFGDYLAAEISDHYTEKYGPESGERVRKSLSADVAPLSPEREREIRDEVLGGDASTDESTRGAGCCHLHRTSECCDPEDCGPCCEDCPTCPTLIRRAAEGESEAR